MILAGSCSKATRQQLAAIEGHYPTMQMSTERVGNHLHEEVERVISWTREQSADRPLVVFSSASPDQVADHQERFGRERLAQQVEQFHSQIADRLCRDGHVRRLVVAGGETSGAMVQQLGIRALQIGPEVAPGVPWTTTIDETPLNLCLKSGNFGGENFFQDALGMLA